MMFQLRFCMIMIAAMSAVTLCGAVRSDAPDFAFPDKVVESSGKDLAEAIAGNNGPAAVRAVMDLTLARSAVSNDNLPSSLRRIGEVASEMTDPSVRAMLDLLKATIYTQIYSDNPLVYDGRTASQSSDSSPDYNLWSAARFKNVVDSLTQSALSEREALLAEPIGRWSKVIANASDRITAIYYPTLYDFVVEKSVELLTSVFNPGNVVGRRYLTALPDTSLPELADRGAASVLAALDSRIAAHESGSAPMVNAAIRRIDFIAGHLFDPSGDENLLTGTLYELYDRVADSEFSGDVLCRINAYGDFSSRRVLWEKVTANMARYPGFVRIGNLKQIAADIERPTIELSYPQCVAPSVPVRIRVKVCNIKDGHIDIYRVNSDGRIRFNRSAPGAKTGTLTVTSGPDIPAEGELELTFVFPETGRYIFVSDIDNPHGDYPSVVVTNLAIATQKFDKSVVWVVDPHDGSPLADVTVMSSDSYDASGARQVGITDPRGSLEVDSDRRARWLYAKKGNDRSQPVYLWSGGSQNIPDSVVAANGFTSLPVYRPGDIIEWSAFCYAVASGSQRMSEGVEVEIEMLDANRSSVDTVMAVTDSFGRVSGRFTAPRGALAGTYTLLFKSKGKIVGRCMFDVSDYKLPTYTVVLRDAVPDASGNYTIEGAATTYAGFPVAGADVTVALSVSPRYWWRRGGGGQPFYTASVKTGADGRFSVRIDRRIIDGSPAPDGLFTATVSVTSASSETVAESTSFMIGKALRIKMNMPEAVDVSQPLVIVPEVVDMRGAPVKSPVEFTVCVADSVVASGIIPSGGLTLRRNDLPQGRARFVMKTADADSLVLSTIFYRPGADTSPVGETLWSPDRSLELSGKRRGTLKVAAASQASMLYTLVSADKIITQKWIKLNRGFNDIDVSLPDNVSEALLYMTAVAGYSPSELVVGVSVADPSRDIKIAIESFRDKVRPGDIETWSLRVTDGEGNGVRSALLAAMYNEAVTALAKPSFAFNVRQPQRRHLSWNWASFGDRQAWFGSPSGAFRTVEILQPEYQTYGHQWINGRRMVMYKMARNSVALSSPAAGDEMVLDEMAVMEHSEEVAVSTSADNGGSISDMEPQADRKHTTETAYRESEVALAFFRPMLTTDPSGCLNLRFTVPDANTTWIADLLAVTSKVAVGSASLRLTASKPLMVQPNLPRFLRAGDCADVVAVVMNGSDRNVNATSVVELFNPADGSVIAEFNYDSAVAADASATVTTQIKAPYDMPLIGYRIRSSADGFTDGEQALIAILPSTTQLIETIPFYIAPEAGEYTVDIPSTPADGRVTLEFCENPVWNVVTALPGLLDNNATTTVGAARSLYSAAVAAGILRSNPAIARGLEEWTRSDRSDSTLVSMLERNSDLKTVLLHATPWVMDARSDTERMTRLSLLFDRVSLDDAVNAAVATLSGNLAGNAWGWISGGNEPSRWATEYALTLIGRLNRLGFTPRNADLQRMVANAVAYVDRAVADDFKRNPSGNYVSYVAMRDMFPDVRQSTAAAAVTSATVQQLLGRWRDLGAEAKATAAMVLEDHNYHASAMQIIESLREYANRSAVKGMWWPSVAQTNSPLGANGVTARILDAFVAVTPSSRDEIDSIRQWLILQKQAQNWGTSDATTAVIASVLTSSQRWNAPARGVEISVDGHGITVGNVERTMGYLRTPIKPEPERSQLTVVKTGDSPAWGAVYRQFADTIANVEASSCEALSISKRLLLVEDTPSGQRLVEIDSPLKTGSRVRVELYVEATRALQYVAITDQRAACFEPVEQMPGYVWSEGLGFYRENTDSDTRMYVGSMPAGKYLLTYDVWVNNAGDYMSGVATAQSQYAPSISAHSSGTRIRTVDRR